MQLVELRRLPGAMARLVGAVEQKRTTVPHARLYFGIVGKEGNPML